MLELLLHHSVQIWLHRYAVSLVQEIKGGEGILQRGHKAAQKREEKDHWKQWRQELLIIYWREIIVTSAVSSCVIL